MIWRIGISRAKAAKELESLDQETMLKYLAMVRLMEEHSKKEEEEIKEGDLAIASRGQELGNVEALAVASSSAGREPVRGSF